MTGRIEKLSSNSRQPQPKIVGAKPTDGQQPPFVLSKREQQGGVQIDTTQHTKVVTGDEKKIRHDEKKPGDAEARLHVGVGEREWERIRRDS